jgi:hypothetical protein
LLRQSQQLAHELLNMRRGLRVELAQAFVKLFGNTAHGSTIRRPPSFGNVTLFDPSRELVSRGQISAVMIRP